MSRQERFLDVCSSIFSVTGITSFALVLAFTFDAYENRVERERLQKDLSFYEEFFVAAMSRHDKYIVTNGSAIFCKRI